MRFSAPVFISEWESPLARQAVDEWGVVAKGIANGKSYIKFNKVKTKRTGSLLFIFVTVFCPVRIAHSASFAAAAA